MSVVAVYPTALEYEAEIPAGSAGDRKRAWYVKCNSVVDTEDSIYFSGRLPYIGSSFSNNLFMTLRTYSVTRPGKLVWKFTGNYSTRPESQQEREDRQRQAIQVPWYRDPEIDVDVIESTEIPAKDRTGKLIANSFGTPYSDAAARSVFAPTIRVTKNYPSIPSWYYTLGEGQVNTDTVVVTTEVGSHPPFPARTLLFVPKPIGKVQREGPSGFYKYVAISFEMRYKKTGWRYKPLDKGFNYIEYVGSAVKKGSFVDAGSAYEGLLDGTGKKLPAGSPEYYNDFKYYDDGDFSVLPLVAFG